MRITLLCVGRANAAPEQALCDSYLKRASGTGKSLGFPEISFALIETSRAGTSQARMEDEASRLARSIPPGAYRAALDERGKSFTSSAFAAQLASLRDSGARDLVIIAGGPDGLEPEFRDAMDTRLALGPQTWPHLLVRAMIAEQIYRAVAILGGHPYHRGG